MQNKEYTEKQLRDKLQQGGYPEEVIEDKKAKKGQIFCVRRGI